MLFRSGCRKVFEWTTNFFHESPAISPASGEIGSHSWEWKGSGQSRYVSLVAAHAIMVMKTNRLVRAELSDRVSKLKSDFPGGDERRKEHARLLPFPNSEWTGLHEQYIFVRDYVANLRHEKYGIVQFLRARGVDVHEDFIEAAWWVLVLRGIAWDMSTTGHIGTRKEHGLQYFWGSNYVPSDYYEMLSPVWII